MKVIDVFPFNHNDRCSMTVVVDGSCPWTGDTLVRARDGARTVIRGVEQFAKFDKEHRTPPGMMIGIVVDKDDMFLPGDEFIVESTERIETIGQRVAERHHELFVRLTVDNADEGANDTCKHTNARPVSTWDCMPPINHWRCFDCGATWSKEDDGTWPTAPDTST